VSEELKKEIRNKILTLLRNQKEEDRLNKSKIILGKFFVLPEFQDAKTILWYASFDGEVDTFEMMKQAKALNKKITLPLINKEHSMIIPREIVNFEEGLQIGPYGIKEPKDECSKPIHRDQLDLVVVPGVAFDKQNHRMGRGGGYYDRFLAALSPTIPAIGLAFDFQIVDHLPHQSQHDVAVSRVIFN